MMKYLIQLIVLTVVMMSCTSQPKKENKSKVEDTDSTVVEVRKEVVVPVKKDTVRTVIVEEVKKTPQLQQIKKTSGKTQLKEIKSDKKLVINEIKKVDVVNMTTQKTDSKPISVKSANTETKKALATPQYPIHSLFDKLMESHVSPQGNVDYQKLKSKTPVIQSYIESLIVLPPKEEWPKNQQLAYWINLYNALTVKLILDNYPIKSVMEINGGKAWDLKLVNIGDGNFSLNNIEHDIIRKKFNEPRIHFAVNCAAFSCPKLLNGAFLPEKLEAQLETQTKYFINNDAKNAISGAKSEISKIFEWYADDFGDLNAFLSRYHTKFNSTNKVSFKEYDWKLNQ